MIWTCFFIVAFTLVVRGKELCNKDKTICEKLEDEFLNRDALAQIQDWWQAMEEKKPVKCTGNPVFEEVFQAGVEEPIFQSMPCSTYMTFGASSTYSFKGEIVDHMFQGPGKWKKGGFDPDDKTRGTCFNALTLAGANISSIVANFKDGKPHGVAKLEMDDGSAYIGKFNHGIRHGFFRHWDSQGRLDEIGYHYNGRNVAKVWQKVETDNSTIRFVPTLMLSQSKEYQAKLDDPSRLLIITDRFQKALDGELTMGTISRSRYVKLDKIDISDCFLLPKWSQITGPEFKFDSEKEEVRYHQGEQDPYPYCSRTNEWNKVDLQRSLSQWTSSLSSNKVDGIWQAEPLEEPLAPDALRFLHDIEHVKGNNFTAKIYGSDKRFKFEAKKRQSNQPDANLDGVITLAFDSDPDLPKVPLVNQTFIQLEGFMKDGSFEGSVVFYLNDSLYLLAKATKNVMHGPVVKLGMRTLFPRDKAYGPEHYLTKGRGLGMAGLYRNGRPEGLFWFGTIGGGHLYGHLDKTGAFTGDHMAFIYPDYETAFLGRFDNFEMKQGRKAKVIAERCGDFGLKELQFSEPEGVAVFYAPPTNESYGLGPKTSDPYEDKFVRLTKSALEVAGEGVFAAVDIPNEQLACPYSGFVYRNEEEIEIYKQRYTHNKSLSDHHRRWGTKYSIGVGAGMAKFEIPIEMDVPGSWMPTTAQKINCDFPGRKQNVAFGAFEHPRYGLIMGAFATRDIKAGDELFADYGYRQSEFPYDFPWYHEFKKEFLKEKEAEILKRAQEEVNNKMNLPKTKKKKNKSKRTTDKK